MPISPVTPADLSAFPGAPFSERIVEAAAATVRRLAGWHITPSVAETLSLDSDGGRVLLLPTLHLTSVTEVRDVSGSTPRVVTGWRMSKNGMISHHGGWPEGFATVEVDVVHGYPDLPAELLPVFAEAAQRKVVQESIGSRSATYASDDLAGHVLSRFTIQARP